ncbi:MAG: cation:proton antiporter [Acidobacteriota bacterium]
MNHGIDFPSFLLAFASALIGAKIFGELAERIGQPAVLGELLVGIVLGPSVLGLVPLTSGVFLLAEIGVVLLLFEVGLETDLGELIRVGAPALVVALVGMALPFAGGYAVTRALGYESLTAVFVGAAMTATSIGITARVLSELHALKTREGQIILGAAVIDDVLGLVVLAIVSRVAERAGSRSGRPRGPAHSPSCS